MLFTASNTFRILTYSALFFRYIRVYLIIFSVKAYFRIFRHYYCTFRLIQAYSAPCLTLACSQTYVLAYLQSEAHLKPVKG